MLMTSGGRLPLTFPTSAALKSFIPCSAWLSMIPPLPRTSAMGQMDPKYLKDTNQGQILRGLLATNISKFKLQRAELSTTSVLTHIQTPKTTAGKAAIFFSRHDLALKSHSPCETVLLSSIGANHLRLAHVISFKTSWTASACMGVVRCTMG